MNRRSLITGLVSFIAAPAVVRASVLMPTRAFNIELLDPLIVGAGLYLNRFTGVVSGRAYLSYPGYSNASRYKMGSWLDRVKKVQPSWPLDNIKWSMVSQ